MSKNKKAGPSQGFYTLKNEHKYRGNEGHIVFRSSWERKVMEYLDTNDSILEWNSEEMVVIYYDEDVHREIQEILYGMNLADLARQLIPSKNKPHRYFIDFYIRTTSAQLIVEVKPQKDMKLPRPSSKNFLTQVLTVAKNRAKWKAATQWAEERGYKFFVWDEVTLKKLGIKI